MLLRKIVQVFKYCLSSLGFFHISFSPDLKGPVDEPLSKIFVTVSGKPSISNGKSRKVIRSSELGIERCSEMNKTRGFPIWLLGNRSMSAGTRSALGETVARMIKSTSSKSVRAVVSSGKVNADRTILVWGRLLNFTSIAE